MKLTRPLLTSFTAALITLSGVTPLQADDTDIYLKASQVPAIDAPKVLIIFDNSGSMDWNITDSSGDDLPVTPAFNSGTTYVGTGGAPASIQSGRVYWSITGGPPDPATDQWFSDTQLNCQTATPLLASEGEVVVGTLLRHDNTNAAWQSNGWKALKGGVSNQTVDCFADRGNGASTSDSDGYLTVPNASNTSYVASTTSISEINWNSFTDVQYRPMLFSADFMAYWYNTGLTNVVRTKIDVAREATKRIINSNPTMHFGMMMFNANNSNGSNSGGRVVMTVGALEDSVTYQRDGINQTMTRRLHLIDILDNTLMNTWTPLSETLWEAMRYYGGKSVDFGDYNNDASSPTPPRPNKCAENSTGSCSYDGVYESPLQYACQKAYVILVTDGAATRDTEADTNGRIDGLSNIGTLSGNRLDELAGWMNTYDINTNLTGTQTVNLYTIGFGPAVDATLLNNAATRGGGQYYPATDSIGLTNAFQQALANIREANSSFTAPALSVNAFNKLYNRDEIYFALFKPGAIKRWNGNVKKYTLCNTADVADASINCAYGDIIDMNKNIAIDPTTNRIKLTAKSYWAAAGDPDDGDDVNKGGAGKELKDQGAGNRVVYTYLDTYASLTTINNVIQLDNATGTYYDAVVPLDNDSTTNSNPTLLGVGAVIDTTSATEVAARKADVIKVTNWILGQDEYDADANSNTTEARWSFQDSLHSRPVALTFGNESNDVDRPVTKLFIGTNDGAIRMINDFNGKEEWAFIPKETLVNQYNLTSNANGDHLYGIDSDITFSVTDVDNDGIIEQSDGDSVLIFVGMRRGGSNIYAFDITPSSVLTSRSATTGITPKLMWVIEGGQGNFARLGQTWSPPLPATVREKCTGSGCTGSQERKVLIFAGGYDIAADSSVVPPGGVGNAIYIVDMNTGARLWWASSDATADLTIGDMLYPIPSELAVMDSNFDKAIDRIYVGDMSGQIFRLDLDSLMPLGTASPNGTTSGYVFADLSCARNASNVRDCTTTAKTDYRRMYYPPDISQVRDPNYSQIPDYDLIAIATGTRADPLDFLTKNDNVIAVNNKVYALRDFNWATGVVGTAPGAIVDSDLYDATADPIGTATTAIQRNAEIATLKGMTGWKVGLKENSAPGWTSTVTPGISTEWIGEKGMAKVLIFQGVLYVTTFTPANPDTTSDTCSASEGLGTLYAFNYLNASAEVDLDGDGINDRSQVIIGGIPPQVVTAIREGGVNQYLGSAKMPDPPKPPTGKTYWFEG